MQISVAAQKPRFAVSLHWLQQINIAAVAALDDIGWACIPLIVVIFAGML